MTAQSDGWDRIGRQYLLWSSSLGGDTIVTIVGTRTEKNLRLPLRYVSSQRCKSLTRFSCIPPPPGPAYRMARDMRPLGIGLCPSRAEDINR